MSEQATDELIAEIGKNSREVIRLKRTTFNGVPLVDARVWTVPAVQGGESKPTKKGLTLRLETWAQLTAALREALGDGAKLGDVGAKKDPLGGDV